MSDKIKTQARIVSFSKSDLSSKMIGEHNMENIDAAIKAVKIVGVDDETIKKTVASFRGLSHRLEFVGVKNKIKFYNDSFATTPESTIIALSAFSDPIILIAGGADKGANFSALAREIKKRVKFVVLLNGEATKRIEKELIKKGFSKDNMKCVNSMKEGVRVAAKNADQGDVVLLSPASASFGMFKNYKERGELFISEIKKQSQ